MWVLELTTIQSDGDRKQSNVNLLAARNLKDVEREYIVGRQGGEADIQVPGKRISRVHCRIHVLAHRDSPVVYFTDVSSFGCFAGSSKTRMNKGEKVKIRDGTELHLDARGTKLIFRWQPTVVCTSKVLQDQKEAIRKLMERVGGTIVRSWREDVTHICMSQLDATMKLLTGLAEGAAIVNPQYFNELIVAKPGVHVNPINFHPPRLRSIPNATDLNVRPERKQLFANHTVLFLSKAQLTKFLDLVRRCSGTPKLYTSVERVQVAADDTTPLHSLATSIVIEPPAAETATLGHLLPTVTKDLVANQRRLISEQHLIFAVLKCASTYTDPDTSIDQLKVILSQQVESQRRASQQTQASQPQDSPFKAPAPVSNTKHTAKPIAKRTSTSPRTPSPMTNAKTSKHPAKTPASTQKGPNVYQQPTPESSASVADGSTSIFNQPTPSLSLSETKPGAAPMPVVNETPLPATLPSLPELSQELTASLRPGTKPVVDDELAGLVIPEPPGEAKAGDNMDNEPDSMVADSQPQTVGSHKQKRAKAGAQTSSKNSCKQPLDVVKLAEADTTSDHGSGRRTRRSRRHGGKRTAEEHDSPKQQPVGAMAVRENNDNGDDDDDNDLLPAKKSSQGSRAGSQRSLQQEKRISKQAASTVADISGDGSQDLEVRAHSGKLKHRNAGSDNHDDKLKLDAGNDDDLVLGSQPKRAKRQASAPLQSGVQAAERDEEEEDAEIELQKQPDANQRRIDDQAMADSMGQAVMDSMQEVDATDALAPMMEEPDAAEIAPSSPADIPEHTASDRHDQKIAPTDGKRGSEEVPTSHTSSSSRGAAAKATAAKQTDDDEWTTSQPAPPTTLKPESPAPTASHAPNAPSKRLPLPTPDGQLTSSSTADLAAKLQAHREQLAQLQGKAKATESSGARKASARRKALAKASKSIDPVVDDAMLLPTEAEIIQKHEHDLDEQLEAVGQAEVQIVQLPSEYLDTNNRMDFYASAYAYPVTPALNNSDGSVNYKKFSKVPLPYDPTKRGQVKMQRRLANDQFATQLTQAFEDYAVEAQQTQAARALDDLLFHGTQLTTTGTQRTRKKRRR
eukprot:TRINITY_DN11677_c0_g1_i4.p1 TRINITY_DN11677_c0_g1~~TRINITY_DN11677_c0_g1_i4.p1  ORF type:complete len:1080 (+),score=290.50 TRINITY_DN11677_c0_g1_i4:120-3359(+)